MQLPARLGKYELQEFLGGGMSHVYRAVDTVIQRTVAVKILTPEGNADPDVKNRFLLEARMAGNISHENVISIYDFGELEGRLYLVMEFLRGHTLHAVITNGLAGSTAARLKIAIQIAKALDHVHQQNIVHRDLKPENIHLNEKGLVKLMDFGIAKTQGLALTQVGFVLGTPFYMAPEQVAGGEITPQVDVYAFGVLLFELMTGEKPIASESVSRLFYSILNEPLKLEPLRKACVPEPVIELVRKCTEKKPEDRPKGCGAVAVALQRILRSTEAITADHTTPGASTTEQMVSPLSAKLKNLPPWAIPAGIGLVALLGAGIYLATARGTRAQTQTGAGTIAAKSASPEAQIHTTSGDMLLIPAGKFLTGAARTPATLHGFYIDRTEVSNASFQAYLNTTHAATPLGFDEPNHDTKPNDPVTNITLQEARDFASWAGQRLPSMLEWEKAARGTDGRLYPWGNDPKPTLANVIDKPGSAQAAMPVDSFPEGKSPFGVLNIGGNVWELVDESAVPSRDVVQRYEKAYRKKLPSDTQWFKMRGGSFRQHVDATRTYEAATIPSSYQGKDVGFRCVKDLAAQTR